MKRVLVTGATGFIGRHCLTPLTQLGYEVHAVFSNGMPAGSAEWHHIDLMDRTTVETLIDDLRPTHLLHFAWYAAHGKFWGSAISNDWSDEV